MQMSPLDMGRREIPIDCEKKPRSIAFDLLIELRNEKVIVQFVRLLYCLDETESLGNSIRSCWWSLQSSIK